MGRSVIITTPMPTLEEFGKSLGISKRRQQTLLRLMRDEGYLPRPYVHLYSAGTKKEKTASSSTKKRA